MTKKTKIEERSNMKIVGQISSPEEAKEMEFIAKTLVVGNRARVLAEKIKKENQSMSEERQVKKEFKGKKTIPQDIPIIWVNV